MALKASALTVGDTYSECLVEDLKRTQIVQYAGASGDYNPPPPPPPPLDSSRLMPEGSFPEPNQGAPTFGRRK